jgi:spore germination protein KA
MFTYLWDKIKFQARRRDGEQDGESREEDRFDRLSEKLSENLRTMHGIIGENADIKVRAFALGPDREIPAALVFIEGMTDQKTISRDILRPLMQGEFGRAGEADLFRAIKEKMLTVGAVEETGRMTDLVDGYLSGDTVLLLDGSENALIVSSKGWEKRAIDKPQNESVVRGPRESFTEDFITNTTLLRRKIQHPDLTIESMRLGQKTRTRVGVAYLKGVADGALVEEVKKRLRAIRTDAILETGYIEQFIEDAPFSIFPTLGNTERPDVLAAKLLEGRVGILVDGTPFVLTAPLLFVEHFQTSEDYYSRPYYASVLRLIRYLSSGISMLLPAVYVALTTFHQELIPTSLLFTMAAAREGTPFPAVLEAGIMVLLFEILKEAGVRLPNPVGQAISIVGALIIGESAVSAGLIGAPMVIIIALTAVAGFIVYALTNPVSILRIVFLVLAGVFGGFGITIGLLGLLVHLSSLQSFGYPYLSPVAPFDRSDMKDALVRFPMWRMKRRPHGMAVRDEVRQEAGVPPQASSAQSGGE